MAVTMMNGVSWDVTPCGSCNNRHPEELSASFIRVTRIGELGTTLALTSNRSTLGISSQCASVASCKNQCFWGMHHQHHRGGKNQQASNVSSN
jgi:hypothetical protein